MEFLKTLGFDPYLLGAQILNFLIIFYLLKRFLYKPVMDMIKKREDTIAEGLKQAEEARESLEKTLEEERKILAKAQTQAKEIVEDARLKSLETAIEIEENATKQAENLILQAKQKIEQDSKEAENRLTQKISIVASDLLTKALQGIFTEKEQNQIINKTLSNIEKIN